MTSENVLFGFHHSESAFTRVHLGGQIDQESESQSLSVQLCPLSGKSGMTGPSPEEPLLSQPSLLVHAGKSHSRSTCPMSLMSRSVPGGGISRFHEDWRHCFHYTILTTYAMHTFAFLDKFWE